MRWWTLLPALASLLHADPRCAGCHPQQVKSYAATGMGRSITKPSVEAVPQQQFVHRDTKLAAEWRSGTLVHKVMRGGQTSAYTIDWAIGSGNAGKSYLIRIGD